MLLNNIPEWGQQNMEKTMSFVNWVIDNLASEDVIDLGKRVL